MNNNMMASVPVVDPNEKKGGNGGLVFLIVVLILALLAACGYIVYDKFLPNNIVKKSTKEALEVVNLEDNHLFQVEDTINTMENAYNYSQSSFFGYIYKSKNINVKDFNVDAALFACVYPELESSANISYVANITVKSKFNKMFGNNLSYSPSTINAGDDFLINYLNDYFFIQRVGEGGFFHPTYFTAVDNVNVEKEKIEVTKVVGYIEYVENNSKISVYKDSSKNELVSTLPLKEGAYSESELFAKYKSKLAEYTYSFVLDKDNFVFYNIKRIK